MSAQDKFDQEYLDDLINDLERLRHERDEARLRMGRILNEIDRLTKERDEARKLYCEQMSVVSRQQDCTPQWFAEEHGWDRLYSKENLEET